MYCEPIQKSMGAAACPTVEILPHEAAVHEGQAAFAALQNAISILEARLAPVLYPESSECDSAKNCLGRSPKVAVIEAISTLIDNADRARYRIDSILSRLGV